MILRIGRKAGVCAAFLAVLLLSSDASAIDRKASYSLSQCIMGGYYERIGEIDKAAAAYQNGLKADRQNGFLHLCMASVYLKKNETDKAAQELAKAGRCDPAAAEPHAVLALLYFMQNKPDEAGREYGLALEKASRLDPKNVTIYKSLAALYAEQGKFEAAERTYKSVIELSPSDPEAYFFLANLYHEQNRQAEAVEWLKKTIAINSDYHPALNYLGYVYADGNTNLDEAERLIGRALELEPDNGAYVDSRGWLLYRRGNYPEAAAVLEKAAGLVKDPVIYDHLGDTYSRLNDPAKARLNWEKALELDPKQDQVRGKLKSAGNTTQE